MNESPVQGSSRWLPPPAALRKQGREMSLELDDEELRDLLNAPPIDTPPGTGCIGGSGKANELDGVVAVSRCFWGRDAPPVGDLKTHASPTSWAARSSRARSPWRRRPCRRTGRQSIIKKTGLTTSVSTGATSNYVIADASEALVSVWRTSAAESWVFVNWALQPEEALHGRPTAGARTVNVGSVVDAVA